MPAYEVIKSTVENFLNSYDGEMFDAVMTDPPYGLGADPDIHELLTRWMDNKHYNTGRGFMGKDWDVVPGPHVWRGVFNLLRPGAPVLAFTGTRTEDLLSIALRMGGFERRDSIAYMYGVGFPKSHNISKAIDKRGGLSDMGSQFKEYLRTAVEKSSLTRSQINEACGFTMRYDIPYEDDPDAWGCTFPDWKKWQRIKEVLHLGDEWDDFIKGVEREVIGQEVRKNAPSGIVSTGRTSHDVVRNITAPATLEAQRFEGYGTALKPSREDVVYYQKPLDGTYAENALKHGIAGLNIDGCRIPTGGEIISVGYKDAAGHHPGWQRPWMKKTEKWDRYKERAIEDTNNKGRWPANVIFSHHPECQQIGSRKIKGDNRGNPGGKRDGGFFNVGSENGDGKPNVQLYGNELVEQWQCHSACPVRILDEQSGKSNSSGGGGTKFTGENVYGNYNGRHYDGNVGFGDKGTASRFFYTTPAASCCEHNTHLDGSSDGSKKWECHPDCPVRILGEQSGETKSTVDKSLYEGNTDSWFAAYHTRISRGDTGTAARFFYTSKVSTYERDAGLDGLPEKIRSYMSNANSIGETQLPIDERTGEKRDRVESISRNHHPTVKPLSVCHWLATLILPPPQNRPRRLLVLYSGSGSEMIGGLLAGWDEVVGVEMNPDYVNIARRRIDYWLRMAEMAKTTDIDGLLAYMKKVDKDREKIAEAVASGQMTLF